MNKILFVVAGLFSFNVLATESYFGRISDLKGEGFISVNGKTRDMRVGDSIEMGAEIIIEHHGQVTFTDNADHRFHLGNSSSAAVLGKSIELRSGDLWFQSLNKNDTYKIKTANAIVEYTGGEAILTYEPGKGKSQLMVINGIMKLANLRQSELNLTVGEGLFSFIDNDYEEGAPRDPTPVGEKTYGQLVSLFSGVAPMDKHSADIFKSQAKKEHHDASHVASRTIASEQPEKTEKKVDIDGALLSEYKSQLLETKSHQSNGKVAIKKTKSKVTGNSKNAEVKKPLSSAKKIVHIFGQTSKPTVAFSLETPAPKNAETIKETSRSRAPASVLDQDVPEDSAVEKGPKPANVNPYSKEYKQQYKESDRLIEDLKKL